MSSRAPPVCLSHMQQLCPEDTELSSQGNRRTVFPESYCWTSISPFSSNWGGARQKTAGKILVPEREKTPLHEPHPAATFGTHHREESWSLGINSSVPGPRCLLQLAPALQSAHSPSQRSINTCSGRPVGPNNRIISIYCYQNYYCTLKSCISLLRTVMIFSLS